MDRVLLRPPSWVNPGTVRSCRLLVHDSPCRRRGGHRESELSTKFCYALPWSRREPVSILVIAAALRLLGNGHSSGDTRAATEDVESSNTGGIPHTASVPKPTVLSSR